MNKTIYSKLFDKEVTLSVYHDQRQNNEDVSIRIDESINAFLRIDTSNLQVIKSEIWKHYNTCMVNIGYGCVPDELIKEHGNTKANQIHFGCFDEECTYKKAKLTEVYFHDFESENSYCSVFFEIPWEDEHGFAVHFKDSEIDSFT